MLAQSACLPWAVPALETEKNSACDAPAGWVGTWNDAEDTQAQQRAAESVAGDPLRGGAAAWERHHQVHVAPLSPVPCSMPDGERDRT